jgi:hypothetical protein
MSDTFRVAYRELSGVEKDLIRAIKSKAIDLDALIEGVADPRYRALAKTSLEQAVMWAVKGVTM